MMAGILLEPEAAIARFKHPTKSGHVTVAGKPGVDVPVGTLKNIWRQAELEEKG
jgi:hypothetical protein